MATDIRFVPLETGTSAAGAQRIAQIDPRLRRTNYFDGQLLKASDLTRDQIYLDERLLELGQAFGGGIVRGLAVSRPGGQRLRVSPGIAVAPSGRVLQLAEAALEIDLADSTRLATLNDGRLTRLPRGLYLLALARAEVIDGVAEAYPRDLAAPRVPRVAAFAEGVQLVLYRLPVGLPRQDELAIRAALAREMLGGHERFALPDDEAVALALLAVDNARLQWLDQGLVRRPQRAPGAPTALQQDLATHYRELMQAVRATRAAAGLPEAFEAAQYFRVLPPHGPCPKAAIDPVGGSHRFFPEAWEVSIAPVRRSDLAAVLADAERLAPIDMATDADIDVMVLVPMADAAYAVRAAQLELPPQAASAERTGLLARRDRLALRVTPMVPVHRQDTDDKVWAAIWAETAPDELLYVRRPPRAAETGVSAIVLAAGATLPAPTAPLGRDLASLEAELDATAERAEAALQAAAASARAREAALAQMRTLEDTVARQREALARTGDERLADALAELASTQAALATAQQELARLGGEATNAQVIAVALATTTAEIERLQQALKAAEERAAKLDDALANAGNTEGLRKELAALSGQLDELRKQREQLQAAAQAADTARAVAERRAEELKRAVDALEERLKQLQNDATGSSGSLDEARKTIEGLSADLAATRETLAARNADVERLAENAKALRAQLDDAQARIQVLEAGTALGVDLDKELSLTRLAQARRLENLGTVRELDLQLVGAPEARLAAVRLFAASLPANDDLLVETLARAAEKPTTLIRLESVVQTGMVKNKLTLAAAMVEFGPNAGLDDRLLSRWKDLLG